MFKGGNITTQLKKLTLALLAAPLLSLAAAGPALAQECENPYALRVSIIPSASAIFDYLCGCVEVLCSW